MKKSIKTLKNSEKAITLISLVVTIIVLLILAGISISMLSGDNGLLTRTTDAKERSGRAEVIEKAKLDVLAQIAENKGETISKDQLKTILNEYFLNINNLEIPDDLSSSDITLNANETYGGYQNISLSDIYNGTFKSKSIIVKPATEMIDDLVIGATIVGYDSGRATDGTIINTSYTVPVGVLNANGTIGTSGSGYYATQTFTNQSITEWKILGSDNGQIVIISANPIQTDASKTLYFKGQLGFSCFSEELDKVCSLYGQGKYADTSKYNVNIDSTIATGGRCINVYDLKRLGYNLLNSETSKTYTMNSSGKVLKNDGTESSYTKFNYWDENTTSWKSLSKGESITLNSKSSTSILDPDNLSTLASDMLKKDTNDSLALYWLAIPEIRLFNNGQVEYDYHSVSYGSVAALGSLYTSNAPSNIGNIGCYVRPVVYLKSDISLSYDETIQTYTIH